MTRELWISVFSSYDDDALGVLGNAGLLRRAHRDVVSERVSLAEESRAEASLRVGEATVRVTSSGPPGAVCDCSAAGVCQHILAASIWLRDRYSDAGGGAGEEGGSTTSALDELLALDPLDIARQVGIASTRLAWAVADADVRSQHPSLELLEVRATDSTVDILLPGATIVVRYFTHAGFAGMVSDYLASEKPERHLTALRMVFAANGREWNWPATVEAQAAAENELSEPQLSAIIFVRASVASLLRAGLAHLGDAAADRLSADAVNCRLAGLHLLSRMLTDASGLADLLHDRSDDLDEPRLARSLAEIAALCASLEEAGREGRSNPELLGSLLGTSRRIFEEAPAVDLVPLDARWFEALSGARGATFTFLDRESGELVTSVSARPPGIDPGLRRDSTNLIWGTSVAVVTSGSFTLRAPRLSGDGTLAASDLSSVDRQSVRVLRDDEFQPIAIRHWTQLLEATGRRRTSFGTTRETTVVLAPARVGTLDLDEVHQRLTWDLIDNEGAKITTTVSLGADGSHRADSLTELIESEPNIVFVVAQRTVIAGKVALQPSSVIVRQLKGLHLVALDFERPSKGKVVKQSALRERMTRIADRLAARNAPQAAALEMARPGIAERIAHPTLDVLDELVVTGRARLNERQRELLRRQQALAADVAVVLISDAIAALLDEDAIEPATLLRCYFLVEMLLTTASEI
jgi:hypothetical protein